MVMFDGGSNQDNIVPLVKITGNNPHGLCKSVLDEMPSQDVGDAFV